MLRSGRQQFEASGQIAYKTLSQKYTSRKRAGGGAQVVEHLPRKSDALSSNPSAIKKKLTLILLILIQNHAQQSLKPVSFSFVCFCL
jgi:hypothetical protein